MRNRSMTKRCLAQNSSMPRRTPSQSKSSPTSSARGKQAIARLEVLEHRLVLVTGVDVDRVGLDPVRGDHLQPFHGRPPQRHDARAMLPVDREEPLVERRQHQPPLLHLEVLRAPGPGIDADHGGVRRQLEHQARRQAEPGPELDDTAGPLREHARDRVANARADPASVALRNFRV
jgi:hypothetical protein